MIKDIRFFAAIIFLASCQKVVDVKVPSHQSALVINSSSEVGDTIQVQVSKTVSILADKRNIDLVLNNASVKLFENGTLVETVPFNVSEKTYKSSTTAQAGKDYKVIVDAPSFTSAEATSSTPVFVPIVNMSKTSNVKLDMDGNYMDELRITFKDPPGKGDYYILKYIPVFPDSFGHMQEEGSVCVYTADASLESIDNEDIGQNTCMDSKGLFFRDALFDGTSKELSLFVGNMYSQLKTNARGEVIYPSIELYHVPEAYFKYMKSYMFANMNNGNPFAEPTNVYTNVVNGYGVFSILSIDSIDVK